jgi:protease YdgD
MKKVTLRVFWLLVCFLGTTAQSVETWNVFGPDARKPIRSYDYPYRTVGYIESSRCSGVLVGKQLVLTAAHCIIDRATQKPFSQLTYFRPNFFNGKSYQKSWITHFWVGTTDLDHHQEEDWAILKIADKLGEGFGWMEVSEEDKAPAQCLGYSADVSGGRTPTLHDQCKILSEHGDIFYHNCHSTRGSSGAPIFTMKDGKAFLIGLNVGEFRGDSERSLFLPKYEEQYANTAIKPARFKDTIRELRKLE